MDALPTDAERRFYLRVNYDRLRSSIGPNGVDLGAKQILAHVPASESESLALRITRREPSGEYNPLGQFGMAWSQR